MKVTEKFSQEWWSKLATQPPAIVAKLEAQLTALQRAADAQQIAALRAENNALLVRAEQAEDAFVEAKSQLTALQAKLAKKKTGCINCGEANDGGYMTEEVGPFCSECWVAIHAEDTRRIAALQAEQAQWQQKKERQVEAFARIRRRLLNHLGDNPHGSNGLVYESLDLIESQLAALTAQQETPK